MRVFVRMGFLKKSNDKKGHVFELLFSDELYNFSRGGEKRSIFRYKSFNVLFWRVKWQLVNLWSISLEKEKIV